jgi:hypothetical protein
MTITVEQMRDKLHPIERIRQVLAATEPLSTCGFSLGDTVRFAVEPGWHHGLDAKAGTDPVDAQILIGPGAATTTFPLTKDALLEATSITGLPKTYASRCPAELLTPQLNYWWREGLAAKGTNIRDYQLLVAGGNGAAITRGSITPFSNLRLLDEVLAGVHARYGADVEVLADYKFTHSLRKTHVRLIVVDEQRTITGTGVQDDNWSVGVQFQNSLIGEEKTSINGYLFRYWCTNGATDTKAGSGIWTRRGGRETDVYEWARGAVDEVLGGLEGSLDAVQHLTEVPIEGQANDVLRDVFEHYRVPVNERTRIIENIVDATGGALTMYSVMAAITEVANDSSLPAAHVDNLLRMGGDLPHAADSRCGECRRMLTP